MANPQQLDIVKPNEIEDTITHLMTKGFLGGAPMPVDAMHADPSMFDHATSGTASAVDGLSSHAMAHGSTIISGPEEGGAFLDRPVGSLLAQQASEQSVEIEQFASEHGPTYLARQIAGAGEMQIAGYDLNVIDFVPGGDLVQMVAGEKFDPSHMMMALAKGKMESEVVHGHLLHRETDQERAERQIERASSPSMADEPSSPVENVQRHSADDRGPERSPWGADKAEGPDHLAEGPVNGPSEGQATAVQEQAVQEQDGQEAVPGSAGARIPLDNDTAARDLAILGHEHARNLDNAVSQWDEQDVHTEMTLHGRKIEIDTHFDAYNEDNRKEREMADEHVREIPIDGNKETVTEGSRMAFRSHVHAHMEAAARDEGITR